MNALAPFWPAPDGADLSTHDAAHDRASLEWWYVHGHVHDDAGREYGLFASFFRWSRQRDAGPAHMHAVTWRLTPLDGGDEHQVTLLDPDTPAEVLHRIRDAEGDRFVRRALGEMMEGGAVPLPDRMLSRPATADTTRLGLDYDGNRLEAVGDGSYRLVLHTPDGTTLDARFTPRKPFVRHGDAGFVRGVAAETMFYYFCPRCTLVGTLTDASGTRPLTGEAWYDHEFGRHQRGVARAEGTGKVAWNWIALQLDSGWEITAYDLYDQAADGASAGQWLVAIDPDGERHAVRTFTLTPTARWTSARTFVRWPTAWRLEVPALGLDLTAVAPVPRQEYATLLSPPAFWEGRVDVTGTQRGTPVTARGYVERSGFESHRGIAGFLAVVGEETRARLHDVLPAEPTVAHAERLVARPGHPANTAGMDLTRLRDLVISPIRHVADLGGKAWRSYALLACIDLVGGDPEAHVDWLAVPELIHVGSLMVDDVQDRSTLRRGGQPAHRIWGDALTVNAGSAAYFLGHYILEGTDLPAATKVRLYETYFHTMRAAHVGQAFDIAGLTDALPDVAVTGDADPLLAEVLLTHRLKSAVPAGNLARMGAMLGGGTAAQEDALGAYFEALGVAFQVVDDVIDIRGTGGLKEEGADLLAGKVTAPVAIALGRLPDRDRQWLADLLTRDSRTARDVRIATRCIEGCGALDAATALANTLLEDAWAALDPLIPPSFAKLNLRAFSWYLLERHY